MSKLSKLSPCSGAQPCCLPELRRYPGVPHEGGGPGGQGGRGHYYGQPRHPRRGLRGLLHPPHRRGDARFLQVRR